MHHSRVFRVAQSAGVFVIAGLLAGCGGNTPVQPSVAPTVLAVAPATDDEQQWIQWRMDSGLRADLAYVRAVATDPTARMDFSIPLLPFEINELNARMANADEVGEIIRREGELAPNSYCGMYLDNQNGGAVTSMWKVNLEGHADVIRKEVRPGARIAFVSCRFTAKQLTAAKAAIESIDLDWMKAVPAALQGFGVNTHDNRIEMEISSAVQSAADEVKDHYVQLLHLPPDMLTVTSDGNGAALVPWGNVDVTLVGPRGILTDNDIERSQLMPGWKTDVAGLACGAGDVGVGFANLPCQAGRWTILVQAPVVDAEWVTIGSGTVTVVAGKTSALAIRLDKVPPPVN